MAPQNFKKVKGNRYYGKTAVKYEDVPAKQPWWRVEQNEMQTLLDQLPRDLKVVDIPFGTGRFVPYYLERGYDVYGLDASHAMISQAAVILGNRFDECRVRTGYSTELPYADGQFDLVVSTRFLRDIIVFSDVKKTLAEFSRVTTKYAILQLGVEVNETESLPPDDERMSSRMSLGQIADLLSSFGFTIRDKRLVKGSVANDSQIFHFLCEKL